MADEPAAGTGNVFIGYYLFPFFLSLSSSRDECYYPQGGRLPARVLVALWRRGYAFDSRPAQRVVRSPIPTP